MVIVISLVLNGIVVSWISSFGLMLVVLLVVSVSCGCGCEFMCFRCCCWWIGWGSVVLVLLF